MKIRNLFSRQNLPAMIVVAVLFTGIGMLMTARLEWTGTVAAEEYMQLANQTNNVNASIPGRYQFATNTLETEPLESPFVNVAEVLRPAVVNISVERLVHQTNMGVPRNWFFPRRDSDKQEERVIPASGSGVIVDAQGYILTNNHVVEDAVTITVRLFDETEQEATVVGSDPRTDLALIKIDEVNPDWVAALGNSDEIRIGDWAVAIGNPLGFDWTLTVGVISAKGRSNLAIEGGGDLLFQDFIQTDAAINFGNSGGPLANIRGEVIGINTVINPSGQGLGFAIPINMARNVVEQFIEQGYVSYGYLGMVPGDLTPSFREALRLEESIQGILVRSVQEDTPAEDGGLEPADVITEVNGEAVTDVSDFRMRIGIHRPGDELELTVIREGSTQTLSFTLADRADFDPRDAAQRRSGVKEEDEESVLATWMGITVTGLEDPRASNDDNMKSDFGVYIVNIEPGSPAEGVLSPGDVIVKVGFDDIRTMEDWNRVTGEIGETDLAVFIAFYQSGSESQSFVALKRRD